MKRTRSQKLFEEAKSLIPGGVNSPVRAFGSVGSSPFFVAKASGSKIWDVDGNRYIDYVASWGPMILGHAHPGVVRAIRKAAGRGTSYGAPTAAEVEMAGMITRAFPSMDQVRMVSSGTEATMSAIRLARGYTKREKILKFEGCYHGHADSLLVKAGSGVATLGIPGSPGIPRGLAELTVTIPFNDLDAVKLAVRKHGKDMACIIVEPVAGNMGLVPPAPGFLEGLRKLATRNGIVLDLRRGHHRIPAALRRFPASRRRAARYDLSRKDHRRGAPRRGLRGRKGDHGDAGAGRPRLPGGHPVGQPPGHGRRDGDAHDAQG